MITDITIENLESHKETNIQFTPGLNVFIGETDIGKSGSLRAMYWVLNNRPLGDWMRPLFWDGTTKSTVFFCDDPKKFDEGPTNWVSRIKGSKFNHYQIGDGPLINAGSGGPPEEVVKIINMDDVNFQLQIDRAYLMFETAAERGRVLNKLAGLDDIDRTMENSKRDRDRLKQELKRQEIILSEKQQQLKQFNNLAEQEDDLKSCENLSRIIDQNIIKENKLAAAISNHKTIMKKIKAASWVNSAEKDLEEAQNVFERFSTLNNRKSRVELIALEFKRLKRQIDDSNEYSGAENLLEKASSLINISNVSSDKISVLDNLLNTYQKIVKNGVSLRVNLAKLEKSIPNICSECGSKLK